MISARAASSDETLIQGARSGNPDAFNELVRKHSRQVYGMSFRMLKNREDAEDNLQNAFCKAYGKIRQFEGKSQFSTWLMRITINEALMMLRRRRLEGPAYHADANDDEATAPELDVKDLHADPERAYLTKELAEAAFEAVRPALRYTFILQKAEGWTSQELAEAMDVTKETVKSRIFRARVRMRERLASLS